MVQLRQCEFILLRYVPDVVAGEAVNFGVVLVEEGWPVRGGAHIRLVSERGWERLERFAPQMDMERLKALASELETDFSRGTGSREGELVVGEMLRKYEEMFSTNVQFSERRGVLAESVPAKLDELAGAYLEHWIPGRQHSGRSGRAAIVEGMKAEFRVWNVLKAPGFVEGLAVSRYAQTKNPMRIDFGYPTRDGLEFKMYHAVAMGKDADAAMRLVATFPKLRQGMQERMRREARLTAVIGENADLSKDEVSFAMEELQNAGIRVETLAAMEGIAQAAAEELGV